MHVRCFHFIEDNLAKGRFQNPQSVGDRRRALVLRQQIAQKRSNVTLDAFQDAEVSSPITRRDFERNSSGPGGVRGSCIRGTSSVRSDGPNASLAPVSFRALTN